MLPSQMIRMRSWQRPRKRHAQAPWCQTYRGRSIFGNTDVGHPSAFLKTNAFRAARTVRPNPDVRGILDACRLSQVFPAVVYGVGVLVVDFEFGPLACHVEPRQPTSGMPHFADLDNHSAKAVNRPRNGSCRNAPEVPKPSENSGFRV